MERSERIKAFWEAVANQEREALAGFFAPDAVIRWHCSNERFTAAEYIRANCEYPGRWRGEVEQVELLPDGGAVSVARVWRTDGGVSSHAVSFFRFDCDKIECLDEYWGDDGAAPQWRQDLKLGTRIKEP